MCIYCTPYLYSPHPYIFFNRDGISITFVGFTVSKNGDLIDCNNQVIERVIMAPQLYTGLLANKVNFTDDHRLWTKEIMINKISTVMGVNKISTVMGVDYHYDPDLSYVLTVDNVIKILAIQMRFR